MHVANHHLQQHHIHFWILNAYGPSWLRQQQMIDSDLA